MKTSFRYALRVSISRVALVVFAVFALAGCATHSDFDEFTVTSKSGVKKVGVSIAGVNHSHRSIMWFSLNSGVGGYTPKRWPWSGTSCCVLLPEVWTPSLQVRVDWETGDAPQQSKTVPIERYEDIGSVYVHFFDNDEVKVVIANVGPTHPNHPIPWIPEPCERTFRPQLDGRLEYAPGKNCPPPKD